MRQILDALKRKYDSGRYSLAEYTEKLNRLKYNKKITDEQFNAEISSLNLSEEEINSILSQDLENYKILKDQSVSKHCSNFIEKGFEYNGRFYGYDSIHDQANFSAQTNLILLMKIQLQNGEITQEQYDAEVIYWKNEYTGMPEPHTIEEFMAVLEALKQHKMLNQSKLWNLRQQIYSATDIQTVREIEWT